MARDDRARLIERLQQDIAACPDKIMQCQAGCQALPSLQVSQAATLSEIRRETERTCSELSAYRLSLRIFQRLTGDLLSDMRADEEALQALQPLDTSAMTSLAHCRQLQSTLEDILKTSQRQTEGITSAIEALRKARSDQNRTLLDRLSDALSSGDAAIRQSVG